MSSNQIGKSYKDTEKLGPCKKVEADNMGSDVGAVEGDQRPQE